MLELQKFHLREKKILIVTDTMQPGGVDSYILSLMDKAHASGWRAELLIEQITHSNLRSLDKELYCVYKSKLYHRNYTKKEIQQAFQKILQKISPHIVHVVCGIPWSCVEVRNITLKNKIPLVFTEQYVHPTPELLNYLQELKNIYLQCARVIFVNENDAAYLLTILSIPGFKNFNIVYNGVEVEKIKSVSLTAAQRQERLYTKIQKSSKIKVLAASRYVYQKGLDILINSVEKLRDEFQSSLCLNIYGTGKEEKELKRLAASQNSKVKIAFYPWSINLLELFNTHDLFIHPSRSESLPFIMLEALASNIPVIASDIKPNLIVTNGSKYAPLFKDGSSSSLAKKIEHFIQININKEGHYSNIAEACSEWLFDNFSATRNLNKVLEIWESMLQ